MPQLAVFLGFHHQQVTIADNGRHDVVELVGHTSGQLPDRLHFLRMMQLAFQVPLLFLGPFPISHVTRRTGNPKGPSLRIPFNHFASVQEPFPVAGTGQHPVFGVILGSRPCQMGGKQLHDLPPIIAVHQGLAFAEQPAQLVQGVSQDVSTAGAQFDLP